MGAFSNFAGCVDGAFFGEPPAWVDKAKQPGATSQKAFISQQPDWVGYLSGKNLVFSPALVWIVVMVADYWVFPYDFEEAKVLRRGWVSRRVLSTVTLTLAFYGFFHVMVDVFGASHRPFDPRRHKTYNLPKTLHNLWYTTLGAAQWALWECGFMYCYATGRLKMVEIDSIVGVVTTMLLMSWFILWRDIHFYFAHKIMHVQCVYKYVHALHHRNTDIEPFSGLSMHPIEHLYYFSCALVPVYLPAMSPFLVKFIGMHALLSPAAGHSGWEDCWQSDQFHYAHHKYFDCNYGVVSLPLDLWFGTFRDRLNERVDNDHTKTVKNGDPKATLQGAPDKGTLFFHVSTLLFAIVAVAACAHTEYQWSFIGLSRASSISALLAFGPLIVGVMIAIFTTNKSLERPRRTLLYPFHNEPILGIFGLHVIASLAMTAVPVYHAMHMFLAPPGEGIQATLYGAASLLQS